MVFKNSLVNSRINRFRTYYFIVTYWSGANLFALGNLENSFGNGIIIKLRKIIWKHQAWW